MEEYTQVKYYMKKYDQIFCTNYNSYGMENPGCVSLEGTFLFLKMVFTCYFCKEKRFLFDEKREPFKVMRRIYIMMHEISHMWFGNYMSLDWWNNLFLKEGFATFFGHKMSKKYLKEDEHGLYSELNKLLIIPDEKEEQSNKWRISN